MYSNEIFVCSPGPGSVAPRSADLVEMNKRRLFGPSLSLRGALYGFDIFTGTSWREEVNYENCVQKMEQREERRKK